MTTNQPTPAPGPAPASAPAPGTPTTSEIAKIWNWIKFRVTLIEADLSKAVGSTLAAKLESDAKEFAESWLYPMAVAACTDAINVVNGEMSVSAAIDSLVKLAATAGKTISKGAALQAIALVQNTLPANTPDGTVTPVA